MEMRCNRHLLHIYYKDHITNPIVCNKMQSAIGDRHYEEILTTVKNGNCDSLDTWSDAVASVKRSNKAQYQGKEKGKIKDWKITFREWSGLDIKSSQRAAEDRERWQTIVSDVSSGAPRTLVVPGHR